MPRSLRALIERLGAAFRRPEFVMPAEMLKELERLGESPVLIEQIGNRHGAESARNFVESLVESAVWFDKWFPKLQAFAASCREEVPFPTTASLSPIDQAVQRILIPKITDAGRVPQRGNYTAAIFSAPLSVLPFVTSDWPSSYPNAVFLTPDELMRWHEFYGEGDDAPWWYCFQDWNAELDPPSDSFWLDGASYSVPPECHSLLVSWGLQWGSLAGGSQSELWCVDRAGTERLLGPLGSIDY